MKTEKLENYLDTLQLLTGPEPKQARIVKLSENGIEHTYQPVWTTNQPATDYTVECEKQETKSFCVLAYDFPDVSIEHKINHSLEETKNGYIFHIDYNDLLTKSIKTQPIIIGKPNNPMLKSPEAKIPLIKKIIFGFTPKED